MHNLVLFILTLCLSIHAFLPPSEVVSPENGAVNVSYEETKFVWNKVEGATSYVLRVRYGHNSHVCDIRIYDTCYTIPKLKPNTTYYWKVIPENDTTICLAPNWSFKTAKELKHINIKTIHPVQTVKTKNVKLIWQTKEYADDKCTSYDVRLGDSTQLSDSNFTNLILDTSITDTFIQIKDTLEIGPTYCWQVRGNNGNRHTQNWSYSYFDLSPLIERPVINETNIIDSFPARLSWSANDELVWFQFELYKDSLLQDIVIISARSYIILTKNRYVVINGLDKGNYYWRVKAGDVEYCDEWTEYSDTGSFTVERTTEVKNSKAKYLNKISIKNLNFEVFDLLGREMKPVHFNHYKTKMPYLIIKTKRRRLKINIK